MRSMSSPPGTARARLDELEEQVRQLLAANDLGRLQRLLADQHPADVADLLDSLEEDERPRVFRRLAPEQAAEVLDEARADTTRMLLAHLPADQAGTLLDRLPMDDVAEILAEDVPQRQDELLATMDPEDAAEVRTLLGYPPQSAGRLMTEQFVRVPPMLTAEETIAYLRQSDPEVESFTDLYVLNPADELVGVVSLRQVITAAPARRLAELMTTRVITVGPDADQEEVARLVSQYDLRALPVVTPEGARRSTTSSASGWARRGWPGSARTTSGGPSSATCSTATSTWPACSSWPATPPR